MIIGKDAETATLRPEIRLALFVVDTYVYRITGQNPVLTCGTNGKHMKGSRHYKASAIDVELEALGRITRKYRHDSRGLPYGPGQ